MRLPPLLKVVQTIWQRILSLQARTLGLFTMTGIDLYRITGGRTQETRVSWDALGFLQQRMFGFKHRAAIDQFSSTVKPAVERV